jgi:flagellar hook-length control protein FliK
VPRVPKVLKVGQVHEVPGGSVSLSIGSMPTESLSDSTAANVAGSTGAPGGLPFDVILDGQTDSSDEETGRVGGADLPVVLRAAEILAAFAAAESADDPLVNLLTDPVNRVRSSQAGKSDLKDSTVIGSIDKGKPANEAAALLLLATQDVLKQLAPLLAPPASAQTEPTVRATPGVPGVPVVDDRVPAVDDRLTENPPAALAGVQTLPSDDSASDAPVSTSTSVDPASLVIDQLNKATAERGDQWPLPDVALPRPTMPAPTAALVDAIGLAVATGTFPDLGKGSNQSSTTAEFERRNAKAGVPPAIRLTDAVGSLDSSIATSTQAPAASAVALPDEAGVASSIVQTLRLQMHDGVGTAIMHLEPEYLGAVSVSLRLENGVVTATIHAESPQVRGWMEANAPLLRESLASQGLTLDRLLVTDDRIADEPSGRQQAHEQEQQARQRPRRDDDATTFEVIV